MTPVRPPADPPPVSASRPKFHIVHVLHPTNHGPMGYREVVETLYWGLTQLGHDVSLAVNNYLSDRINIFIGGQMLAPAELERIPAGSIFYHLEQIANVPPESLIPSAHIIASRFRIWEYNAANINTWRQLNPAFTPELLPICWSPNLRRIQKLPEEDIDVLFYGQPSASRFAVFDHLCRSGAKCLFACGLYGPSRDSLIARSKIVLNLNVYEATHVFEIVRVSYLLANEKAVVSDIYPDSSIDPDIREALVFASPPQITDECVRLLKDDYARAQLALRGRTIFERRDIRPNLQRVLSAIDK